jgi:hypothetical protein
MTEADWLACTEPQRMLAFLRGKVSDRKLRLFAVACCRQVCDLIMDERSFQAIDAAEHYADGLISDEVLGTFRNAARLARKAVRGTTPLAGNSPHFNAALAADAVVESSGENTVQAADWVASAISRQAIADPHDGDSDDACEAIWHFKMFRACPLFRDIFGNPFRPVAIFPAWKSQTVVSLAQAAYEQRELPAATLDPTRLAVLADALEDAGCTQAGILNHLRGPGPHVRGCWVSDLLLGKE